jgi:integrase/recombinase XerD
MARSRSYAERVNVLKKVLINGVWKFVPVIERNGKIVRDHVLIAGSDQHHAEGSYYIEWYEGSRRRKQCVGSFEKVLDAARCKSIELNARKAGIATVEVTPPPGNAQPSSPSNGRLTKNAAIDDYLAYVKTNRAPGTYKAYRYTLDALLRASFSPTYIDEATRDDILKFIAFCADRGYQPRTIYDKVVVVNQFFKRHDVTKLLDRSDWPKYVETIRPIYEPEEIRPMLQNATLNQGLRMKFFLASGFRDKEVRYVTWYDIDFRNCLARVTKKPRWKFFPKNYEERAVPLPTSLIEQLRELKEETKALPSQPVFSNSKGNPTKDHLFMVKRVAHRAGLNCGQCTTEHGNRCSEGAYCMRFFLHKFRHTYATEHLRHGVDIRTLQLWLGHRDIKSTMVYLKGVQSKDALVKVNGGMLAAYVDEASLMSMSA